MTKIILTVLSFFGVNIRKYAMEKYHLYDTEQVRTAIQKARTHSEQLTKIIGYDTNNEGLIMTALINPDYVKY